MLAFVEHPEGALKKLYIELSLGPIEELLIWPF
jgi:hypothetical protein